MSYNKRRRFDTGRGGIFIGSDHTWARPYEFGFGNATSTSVGGASSAAEMVSSRTGAGPGGSTRRAYLYKRKTLARQKPSISNLCPYVVERLQGIKKEVPDRDPDATVGVEYPGFFPIGKGATGTNQLMPLYIFDLTRVDINNSNSVCWRLGFNSGGTVTFNDVPTQGTLGTLGANSFYAVEKQQVSPLVKTYLNQNIWYDMRMKLYGARKQAVTYDIMLVRFKEDYLAPDLLPAQNSTDVFNKNQFWQGMVRSSITNSILPMVKDWRDGMTILARKRVKLCASLSTDLDRVPDNIDFKFFIKDTRILSYQQNNQQQVTQAGIDSVGWVAETNNSLLIDPRYSEARTFVIVRATDMTLPITNDDGDDTPSFDFIIRRKRRYIPQ